MPAIRLDGLATAKKYTERLKDEITSLSAGRKPHLCVILVGEDPASEIYVRNKAKSSEYVGITSSVIRFASTVSQKDVELAVHKANIDPTIDAILVQLPLPKHLDAETILCSISPEKDADGLHPTNIGKLVYDTPTVAPCTPSGIITLLQEYSISPSGKHVVIVGRSVIVGKTMSLLFLRNTAMGNATVTVCHSRTTNLAEYTRSADILIVAIGKPQSITADMVTEQCTVIDVGINRIEAGIVGDCNFTELFPKVHAITPVPKGIGPMTIYQLLHNTFILWKKHLHI